MLGLYIHIPFCARRCPYCDFAVDIGASAGFVSDYVAALRRELTGVLRGAAKSDQTPLTSVFLGGGTPTFLAPQVLSDVLQWVRDEYAVAPDAEISLEANPEDLGGEEETASVQSLETLRAAGWNRISMGAQSFDDEALKRIGRRHMSTHVRRAFSAARRAGFENISLDLMFALPGQSRDQWRDTLRQALELEPEHLSCYALTIEAGTPFSRRVARGQLLPMADDEQAELMNDAFEMTRASGLDRYEVSNYARRGFECRHNLNYWRGGDYLAVGCGAHGHRAGHRWWNERDAKTYVKRVEEEGSARAGEEWLSPRERLSEIVMLGLRLREGFGLESVSRDLKLDAREALGLELREMARRGVVLERDGIVKLAPHAVALADGIAARLM